MTRFLPQDLKAYQNEYSAAPARPMTTSQNLKRLPDMAGFRSLGAEERAHFHVAFLVGREFQQLRRRKAEPLRDDDIRKDLHSDVIQIDLIVVEFAAGRDGLFQSGDPRLQSLEGFG